MTYSGRVERFSRPERFHCIIDRRKFLRGRVACVLSGQTRVYACSLKLYRGRQSRRTRLSREISISYLRDAVFFFFIKTEQLLRGERLLEKFLSPFVREKSKRTRNWRNVKLDRFTHVLVGIYFVIRTFNEKYMQSGWILLLKCLTKYIFFYCRRYWFYFHIYCVGEQILYTIFQKKIVLKRNTLCLARYILFYWLSYSHWKILFSTRNGLRYFMKIVL